MSTRMSPHGRLEASLASPSAFSFLDSPQWAGTHYMKTTLWSSDVIVMSSRPISALAPTELGSDSAGEQYDGRLGVRADNYRLFSRALQSSHHLQGLRDHYSSSLRGCCCIPCPLRLVALAPCSMGE